MTPARSLVAEIPALRRFSRALVGHAGQADTLLEDALAALLSNPLQSDARLADQRPALRLDLLKSLVGTLPIRLEESDPCGGCAMERAAQSILLRLPMRPRIAFLLRTLEELCDDEIAYVMGVSTLQARLLVELGSASIAGEISTRVLIIESNASTADQLENIVKELGHTSCGKARSSSEALALADRENPGLILTELTLPDELSGHTMLHELLKNHDVPVIIITERPELWVNNSNISPAGFITKPFLSETVRSSICNALFFNRRAKYPFFIYEAKNLTSH